MADGQMIPNEPATNPGKQPQHKVMVPVPPATHRGHGGEGHSGVVIQEHATEPAKPQTKGLVK
jgi:hypothetical protein